ncbi:MAG: CDP-glycerol glycerophosphotransferase family protein [Bacilli bacterium]|nr:CDP-glycerol glycerophosphotransferase family protein [Bacilli bacterium]
MIVVIKIFILVLNFIYFFIKLLPTQNKVVMISRQSNKVNTDFKLLGKKLKDKYKVVYLCKTLEGGIKSKWSVRIKYFFHMFRQMYHLATSKVCILDTYCPTVSILRQKKSLTVIQMWHSVGTMKLFGYAVIDRGEGSNYKIADAMKMHKNYTFACAASDAYKDHLSRGFNIPKSMIKTFTLPRIDLLTDKKHEEKIKNKIYTKYPSLKDKPNIIFAPTFRKKEASFNRRLDELVKNFDFKKYNLIVKLHPLSKIKITNKKVLTAKEFSTFDMLFVADKLISDYSCIIYEAGVRNIPLYFYDYDLDYYKTIRGLAIDYNELPGYKCDNAKDLVKSFEKEYDYAYLKKFINKYVENRVNCTEKLVKEIERYMK